MADAVSPQTAPADAAHGSQGHGAGGGDAHGHGHNPFLAHHFETMSQQFDSGKLGMWLFLGTEILLFGGLFCAYAIWRGNHPEIFHAGHQHLNKTLGAINTVVLLLSSFTMAWAVRCAQTSNRNGLILGLTLTLLGGFGFMGIKYFEYSEKIAHGYRPGKYYAPKHDAAHAATPAAAAGHAAAPAADAHAPAPAAAASDGHASGAQTAAAGSEHAATPPPAATPPAVAGGADAPKILPAAVAPGGLAAQPAGAGHGGEDTPNVHLYFSIYFCLTGLHGIHVLAGMTVIAWLLMRSVRGDFSSAYFDPVDLGGLYWHLVDLIWIYLFPLLYLID
ncbi:Cytochrome c oxidase subunit 3 [Phycisphaerae bacterium RAS1]|nr:Cytochrome c oxidase subunit 3 [Phycisphaerae bacterium RAS1]